MAYKEYKIFWYSLPWWKRFYHIVWWKLATIKAAILSKPSPMEKLLLKALAGAKTNK